MPDVFRILPAGQPAAIFVTPTVNVFNDFFS
jgi:hypothetical protein